MLRAVSHTCCSPASARWSRRSSHRPGGLSQVGGGPNGIRTRVWSWPRFRHAFESLPRQQTQENPTRFKHARETGYFAWAASGAARSASGSLTPTIVAFFIPSTGSEQNGVCQCDIPIRTMRMTFFPSFPVCSVVESTAYRTHSRSRPRKGNTMAFYEKGHVRIHYQEAGSGFPLFVIPGGGQNSTIGFMSDRAPFNAIEEFKDEYRCITADLRNAPSGQSSGPLEIDRPWDSYADDHLALMDHLGIQRFMVIGYCIGGPFT